MARTTQVISQASTYLRHPRAQRWLDWFVASDPGFTRLQQAFRTTLTVICGVFTVYLVLLALGMGKVLTIPLLAGMVGLMSSFAVNDPSPRQKQVTMLVMAVVSVSAVFLATVISPYQVLKNLALLAVIFIAYYLRRFGPRFLALGMIGFISFYFASLVQTKMQQMPLLILAIFVGIGWSYLFRFLLLPDRPERILPRMLRSCYARTALVLAIVCEIVETGRADGSLRKRLNRGVSKLNDCAMAVEGQIADGSVDAEAIGIQPERARLALFDIVISIETIAGAVQRAVDEEREMIPDVRGPLLNSLRTLQDAFHQRDLRSRLDEITAALDELDSVHREHEDERRGDAGTSWSYPLRRVELAGRWIVEDVRRAREPEDAAHEEGMIRTFVPDRAGSEESVPDADASSAREQGRGGFLGLREKLEPTTIQAIQALVAGAISIVLRYALSPGHQYWTVLAAFVVLSNAGSIGKTYNRAFQRVGGTLLGAIAGFGVATLVAGSEFLEISLAFVCVFFAFYLFSVAYGLMVIWVTMMLALMYDMLLGGINEQLLQARFIDTLVGAGVGLLMSIIILPTRTSQEAWTSVKDFLTALDEYIGTYLDQMTREGKRLDLTEQAIELGDKLQQARTVIDVMNKQPGSRSRSGSERMLTTLIGLNYYARQLTNPAARGLAYDPDLRTRAMLQEAKERIGANVEALINRVEGRGEEEVRSLEDIEEFVESRVESLRGGRAESISVQEREQAGFTISLRYIWHINQAIVDLAVDLGAVRKEEVRAA